MDDKKERKELQKKIIRKHKKNIEYLNEEKAYLQEKIDRAEEEKFYQEELEKIGWKEESSYPLNKIINCSLCGNKFTAYVTKSKNRYYRCQGYRKKVCIAKSINAKNIEDAIRAIFFETAYNPMVKENPEFYEEWGKTIFTRMTKKILIGLTELSQTLPFSSDSIDKLRNEFNNKILKLEENIKRYEELSNDVKEKIVKFGCWHDYKNYINIIKFEGKLFLI